MPEVNDYTFRYSFAWITVRKWDYLPSAEDPTLEAARMRVEVIETSPDAIPLELFVWERHTVYTEGAAENKDRALCVAKVSDLSVYPKNDPDEGSDIPPFYRSKIMDLVFSSPEDFLDTWTWIRVSIQRLLEALVKLELINAYGS